MFIRFYNGAPTLDAWNDKSPLFIDDWRPCERIVEAAGGVVMTDGSSLRLFDADGEEFLDTKIGTDALGCVLLDGIYYGDFEIGNERQGDENRHPLLQWAMHQSDSHGKRDGWEVAPDCRGGGYVVQPRPTDDDGWNVPDGDDVYAEVFRLAREAGVECDGEGRLVGLHSAANTPNVETAADYPAHSRVAATGEMIIPESDGSAKTLLQQVKCILDGRGSLDYCPTTGEVIIRTGLDIHMGGELIPNSESDDDA